MVQVDHFTPALKAPVSHSLKLNYDEMLSNVAFKFNMRRHSLVHMLDHRLMREDIVLLLVGRGLHSSTFQLNLSHV